MVVRNFSTTCTGGRGLNVNLEQMGATAEFSTVFTATATTEKHGTHLGQRQPSGTEGLWAV